jgi:hypothetical protein
LTILTRPQKMVALNKINKKEVNKILSVFLVVLEK